MELVFVTEARFVKNSKGIVYTMGGFPYSLWERYLNVFDSVKVIARINEEDNFIDKKENISSGDNVTFLQVPYYIGPLQYFLKKKVIIKNIESYIKSNLDSSYICRVPGTISSLVISKLEKHNKAFGVEVVGDPEEVFSKGNFNFFIRVVFKNRMKKSLINSVARASAVLYVTKHTLQKKYPPSKNSFTTHASNVSLPETLLQFVPKKWSEKKSYKVVSIGTLEQMYKSPEIVIEAIDLINKNNNSFSVNLIWLGDGRFKTEMKDLVSKKSLDNCIFFRGNVSKEEVFKTLVDADIFVLASRTEGLPRVIIEAMACGIPCIGTAVGGIPELLNPEALVPPSNAYALANKIKEIISSEKSYNTFAQRNLEEAKKYTEDKLQRKREEFYRTLKKLG